MLTPCAHCGAGNRREGFFGSPPRATTGANAPIITCSLVHQGVLEAEEKMSRPETTRRPWHACWPSTSGQEGSSRTVGGPTIQRMQKMENAAAEGFPDHRTEEHCHGASQTSPFNRRRVTPLTCSKPSIAVTRLGGSVSPLSSLATLQAANTPFARIASRSWRTTRVAGNTKPM